MAKWKGWTRVYPQHRHAFDKHRIYAIKLMQH
jgi:hypothetical protein